MFNMVAVKPFRFMKLFKNAEPAGGFMIRQWMCQNRNEGSASYRYQHFFVPIEQQIHETKEALGSD